MKDILFNIVIGIVTILVLAEASWAVYLFATNHFASVYETNEPVVIEKRITGYLSENKEIEKEENLVDFVRKDRLEVCDDVYTKEQEDLYYKLRMETHDEEIRTYDGQVEDILYRVLPIEVVAAMKENHVTIEILSSEDWHKDMVKRAIEEEKEADEKIIAYYRYPENVIRVHQPYVFYTSCITHEIGHFVDKLLGQPSESAEFLEILYEEYEGSLEEVDSYHFDSSEYFATQFATYFASEDVKAYNKEHSPKSVAFVERCLMQLKEMYGKNTDGLIAKEATVFSWE